MFPRVKLKQVLGLIQVHFLSKAFKEAGRQVPILSGYLSDSSRLADRASPVKVTGCSWTEALPYQVCRVSSNQRQKKYLDHPKILESHKSTNHFSKVLERDVTAAEFSRLMSTIDTSKGGPVKEAGGRVGRLDAANESGMFHKVNKSKLDKLKQILKEKILKKESTADPAAKKK